MEKRVQLISGRGWFAARLDLQQDVEVKCSDEGIVSCCILNPKLSAVHISSVSLTAVEAQASEKMVKAAISREPGRPNATDADVVGLGLYARDAWDSSVASRAN